MENKYTVKQLRRGEWLVMNEYGETFALLEKFTASRWRAFTWEEGQRLYIGDGTVYVADLKATPEEVAQYIEY